MEQKVKQGEGHGGQGSEHEHVPYVMTVNTIPD